MTATVTAKSVQELRERTGLGIMECKKALSETGGDHEKAYDLLRKQGLAKAEKKVGRTAAEGVIASYIHTNNKVGVLLELNCETDFAARNEMFMELAKDLCLHVAATNPSVVSREEVDPELVAKEKEIAADRFKDKPPQVLEKILEGNLNQLYERECLLDQPFVKEPSMKVADLIKSKISVIGENIQVARFSRMQVGQA